MIKKLLCIACAIFMIFPLGFTVFSEEGAEYYEEYDNYDELKEDYSDYTKNPQPFPDQTKKDDFNWYDGLSHIPLIIGLIAGALTVIVLFRKQSIARHHTTEHPYPIISDIRHTVISDANDNTL